MKINCIGHLAFTCKDLDKSIEFYRDKLGFRHKFSITFGDFAKEMADEGMKFDPEKVFIAYFDIGNGSFFELFDKGGATEYALADGKHFNFNHVALLVDDIYKAQEELKANGVPIDTPPRMGLEFTYQMWSHDPDGNKIEFMQYTDKSWQLVGR